MSYSKPMQILVDEHTVILSVLDAVEAVAQRPGFSADFYAKAFEFFPAFADKCHHAKEEDQLFPLLEQRGVPKEGGPLACMLHEHEDGRAHIAAIKAALPRAAEGDASAQQKVRAEALEYVDLLRQHIAKENQVLFVMGDHLLTDADKELLTKRFNCREHSPLPPGSHEKYLALAEELRGAAGLEECTGGRTTTCCQCGH